MSNMAKSRRFLSDVKSEVGGVRVNGEPQGEPGCIITT
jgi:hypothetical protein